MIKSGGEWISSIDIENIAMEHPGVAQAACVGVPHPKWDERPLLLVVKAPGAEVTALLLTYTLHRKPYILFTRFFSHPPRHPHSNPPP